MYFDVCIEAGGTSILNTSLSKNTGLMQAKGK